MLTGWGNMRCVPSAAHRADMCQKPASRENKGLKTVETSGKTTPLATIVEVAAIGRHVSINATRHDWWGSHRLDHPN